MNRSKAYGLLCDLLDEAVANNALDPFQSIPDADAGVICRSCLVDMYKRLKEAGKLEECFIIPAAPPLPEQGPGFDWVMFDMMLDTVEGQRRVRVRNERAVKAEFAGRSQMNARSDRPQPIRRIATRALGFTRKTYSSCKYSILQRPRRPFAPKCPLGQQACSLTAVLGPL